MGQERKLLERIKDRKLKYFGHISRHNSLKKDIMLSTMLDLRRHDGQRRQWLNDLCEWTGMNLTQLVCTSEDRTSYHILARAVVYARPMDTVH